MNTFVCAPEQLNTIVDDVEIDIKRQVIRIAECGSVDSDQLVVHKEPDSVFAIPLHVVSHTSHCSQDKHTRTSLPSTY